MTFRVEYANHGRRRPFRVMQVDGMDGATEAPWRARCQMRHGPIGARGTPIERLTRNGTCAATENRSGLRARYRYDAFRGAVCGVVA